MKDPKQYKPKFMCIWKALFHKIFLGHKFSWYMDAENWKEECICDTCSYTKVKKEELI